MLAADSSALRVFRSLERYKGVYTGLWFTSNAERSRVAPWYNSTLGVVAEGRGTSVVAVLVHVCENGCADDYENGSGCLAESQADGDVASTARWNINGKKVGRIIDVESLSHGYSFCHRVYTDGIVPMVDRAERCLLSVTTSAR